MKHQMRLLFTAALFTSLAFADNPTDAPLAFTTANPPAAQKETRPTKHRRHADKKEQQRTLRVKDEAPAKSNPQPEPANHEYTPTGNF
jgi:hypothetical protein